MLKVLAICGNGMGTSMIIKVKVKSFLEKQNIKAECNSCSLGEATGYLNQGTDIALCAQNLLSNIHAPERTKLIGLKNLMDEKEFGPRLLQVIQEHFPSQLGS